MEKRESQALPIVAILVLAVIWGYNWIMMKVGVAYAPPFTFAALRAVLGAVVLFAFMALMRKPFAVQAGPQFVLVGLLQTTGFIGFSTWALSVGGAGKTVVLVYTMPFWIVLFGWPLLGERVRGYQWPALGFGLIGLILLLDPKTGGSLAGDVLAILAGLSWGLASIVAKRLYRRGDVDLISFTTWQMFFGTGLVKTSEDFGVQGERPRNRELLDFLATEFVRTGWSIKALHRLILTSRTYQQASAFQHPANEKVDAVDHLPAQGPHR